MTDQQGKTVTVNVANDTPIVKTALGTTGDIKAGTRILVAGARSQGRGRGSLLQHRIRLCRRRSLH